MANPVNLPGAPVRAALLREAVARHPTAPLMRALSDVLFELESDAEAATWFRAAYLEEPGADLLRAIEAESPDRLIRRAEALIAAAAGYSPVIATLAIAYARCGRRAELSSLVDYARFLTVRRLPPTGQPDESFRRALESEILHELTPYYEPRDRAIRHAMRNDALLLSTAPAATAFRAALEAAVRDYLQSLPADSDHPFIRSRPAEWGLEGWAVVSDDRSYHHSHIHTRAWLSGVYYLVRPPVSHDSAARRGWLRVSAPSHLGVGDDAGWPEAWIEPAVGSMVLMPAYFFHETRPLEAPEQRICVAFDVVPQEILDRAPQGHGSM